MNIWFTSDTHFSHDNIIKYTNRPFKTIEEMNNTLIYNWNKVVKPYDKVYFLGDFCWKEPKYFINRLAGTIEFIKGNHDKAVVKHLGENKFASIKEIKVNEITIIMCHFAMRVWNKSHHNSYHLYGHSHNTLEPYGNSVDIGVDSTWITGKKEYRPFNFDEIKSYFDNRK